MARGTRAVVGRVLKAWYGQIEFATVEKTMKMSHAELANALGVTVGRWAASAITLGIATVTLAGCMSLQDIRASEPTHTTVVRGSAPVIARCIQSALDLSVSDSNPGGTEFALLAPCDVCVQGPFYEIYVWQLPTRAGEWDRVQVELRENSTFLLGTGDPWKKVERCVKP